MAIDYKAHQDALVSIAQRVGHFDEVAGHEPKNAPGKGLSCFVFYEGKRTIQSGGLNSSSALVRWVMQVRKSMTSEPQDAIDTDMLAAVDAIYAELIGNFTLDIQGVRGVDVHGAEGDPLNDAAGHVDQDGHKFRFIEVFVGLICNDAWTQGA